MSQLELIQPCEDWDEYLLSDVAKTTSGGTPNRSKKEYYQGTIPWVKSGELNDNFLDSTEEHISEEGLKKSSAKLFPVGTLLMAMYGATVGKTSILKIEATTNQAVCGILPDETIANTEFLRFQLVFFRKKLLSERYGGAQPNISQTIIKNIRLRLPSLPEQQRIVHVLTTVQIAIEQQARLIALTRELKSALMKKLFTEGLRGEKQKETEVGLVPESWDVVELANLLEETEQVNLRTEGNRQINYIDVSSISREYLRVETTTEYLLIDAPGRARKKVRIGDVIFATVRPTLLRVAYISEKLNDQVCSTAFCVLRAKKNVSNKYIHYVVQREQFIKQLAAIESGASYPAVTDRQVNNQKIPVPKFDEQTQIAEMLDVCDKKAFQHSVKKEKLEELFRTLLHQLMTGQIRTTDITGLRDL